jgi:hypothetical protein
MYYFLKKHAKIRKIRMTKIKKSMEHGAWGRELRAKS